VSESHSEHRLNSSCGLQPPLFSCRQLDQIDHRSGSVACRSPGFPIFTRSRSGLGSLPRGLCWCIRSSTITGPYPVTNCTRSTETGAASASPRSTEPSRHCDTRSATTRDATRSAHAQRLRLPSRLGGRNEHAECCDRERLLPFEPCNEHHASLASIDHHH